MIKRILIFVTFAVALVCLRPFGDAHTVKPMHACAEDEIAYGAPKTNATCMPIELLEGSELARIHTSMVLFCGDYRVRVWDGKGGPYAKCIGEGTRK